MGSLLMGLMMLVGFVWCVAGVLCMFLYLKNEIVIFSLSFPKQATVVFAAGPVIWIILICYFVGKALIGLDADRFETADKEKEEKSERTSDDGYVKVPDEAPLQKVEIYWDRGVCRTPVEIIKGRLIVHEGESRSTMEEVSSGYIEVGQDLFRLDIKSKFRLSDNATNLIKSTANAYYEGRLGRERLMRWTRGVKS